MFKKINLDHCYTQDKNHKFFKSLEKMGFRLQPGHVEHPGKAICTFIALQSNNKRERFYLEFVHIGKGGVPESAPGLSFNFKTNLESFSNNLSKKLGKTNKVLFGHKNYDWLKNSEDRLPGWNFLNFKKQPIKNIFTWFTEYEPRTKAKIQLKPKAHPNSVYSVHGIELVLTEKSKINLEKIFGKKLKPVNVMPDDSILYIENGKKDFFKSIILNCKSLKKAKVKIKKFEEVEFVGHEAVRVRNRDGSMWNLIIIEN